MVDLTLEQRQLAKRVHDYACRFPLTENGDAQLFPEALKNKKTDGS